MNKLAAEKVAARLVSKIDFDNKLISFTRKITSNKRIPKTEAPNKLNSWITKYYHFFLGINYFTSNGGSQNPFVYQSTLIP